MFDILALPAMIRNTIYFYVFEPENEDTFIRPASIREGQGVAGVSLLRTCKQVAREAIPILYGTNTFTFCDRQHGDLFFEEPGSDLELPMCDFVGMYNFLDWIRKANRLALRHIRLEFTDNFFTRYRDECGEEWRALGHGGANHIGNALELLAEWHALRTFDIAIISESITGCISVGEGLVWRGYEGRLIRKLSCIRGLDHFDCLVHTPVADAAAAAFQGIPCCEDRKHRRSMDILRWNMWRLGNDMAAPKEPR